jgi:RNA recognition motif. (a.k.a. RRM, RBD, or RNP domain)
LEQIQYVLVIEGQTDIKKISTVQTSKEEKHDDNSQVKSDKEKILKVSWERTLGEYNATRLREIFEKFGKVEDVVIRSKKSKNKGTALVVMSSKDAVVISLSLSINILCFLGVAGERSCVDLTYICYIVINLVNFGLY